MQHNVALPRVLDIKTFVTARDVEVATLVHTLKQYKGSDNYGAPSLARHLRRRATSHRRYIYLRRPNARLSAFKRQRRDGVGEGHGETEQRPTNRRMRRRPARLQAVAMSTSSPMQQAGAGNTDTEMADADASVSTNLPATAAAAPKGCRLESHTWHARRMRMHSCMWGHALPMQAAGRGKGSRSLLHHMRTHALMHDASYWGCIQLRGHQRDLATILKSMTDPAVLRQQLARAEVHCGAAEWQLTLHSPGAFPAGTLCPVKLMWVPLHQHTHSAATDHASVEGPAPAAETADKEELSVDANEEEEWYPECLLWVWVHAGAMGDVVAAVGRAQADMQARGRLSGAVHVGMVSEGLRRLEVVGGGADDVVQRVVAAAQGVRGLGVGAYRGSEGTGQHQASASVGSRLWASVAALSNSSRTPSTAPHPSEAPPPPPPATHSRGSPQPAAQAAQAQPCLAPFPWPQGCVVGVTCTDPRLATPVRAGALRSCAVHGATVMNDTEAVPAALMTHQSVLHAAKAWPESGDWTDGAHTLLHHAAAPTPPAAGPPPPSQPLPRPLPEASVGRLRQQARRRALHLPPLPGAGAVAPLSQMTSPRLALYSGGITAGCTDQAPVASGAISAATAAGAAGAVGAVESAGAAGAAGAAGVRGLSQESTQCPVLLVRQQHGEWPGWSIILPAGWIMPFWLALAFTGATPTGQLEWRWAAAQSGRGCFPWDWPHTPAGDRLRCQLAAEFATLAELRPLGKAPKPPGLPYIPWACLGGERGEVQGDGQLPGVPRGRVKSRGGRQQVGGREGGETDGTEQMQVQQAEGQQQPEQVQQQQQGTQALLDCQHHTAQLGVGGTDSHLCGGPSSSLQWAVLGTKALLQRHIKQPCAKPGQVYAWVVIRGKGRCEAGAEITWVPPCGVSGEAGPSSHTAQAHAASAMEESTLGAGGEGEAGAGAGAAAGHAAQGAGAAGVAGALQQQPGVVVTSGAVSPSVPGALVVLGYVLSACPRGTKPTGGWGASRVHSVDYPGGLAMCDAMWVVRAGTEQQAAADAGKDIVQLLKEGRRPQALGSTGFVWPGAMGIRVKVRNPGTQVMREASLFLALESGGVGNGCLPCL